MADAQGMVDKLYTAFSQLPPEMKAKVADIAMQGAGSKMSPANRARAMDLLSQNGKYAEMQMQRAGVQMPSSYEPEMGSAHNFNVLEGVDRLMRQSERGAPAAPAQSAPKSESKAPAVGKRPGDRAQVANGEQQTAEYSPPTRRSEANTRTPENDPSSRVARKEMNPKEKEGDKDLDDTSLAGKVAGAAAAGVAGYIAYRAYKNRTQAVIADGNGKVLGEATPADIKALPKFEEGKSPRGESSSRMMTPRQPYFEGEDVVMRSMQGPIIEGEYTEIPPQKQIPQQRAIQDQSATPDGGDRIPAMANEAPEKQIAGPKYSPQEKMIQDAQRGAPGIDATIARSLEDPEPTGRVFPDKSRPKIGARTPRPSVKFR